MPSANDSPPAASILRPVELPTILPPPTPNSITAALPAPGTFDFIPSIHALLSRLLLDPADKNALQPKDLANEVSSIRRAIAQAKVEVQAMPGIGRTVDGQEIEIKRVTDRVERLRVLIEALGEQCEDIAR